MPEFRALMRFLRPDLGERDIPGRTKIRTEILSEFERVMQVIKSDLQVRVFCIMWL